MTSSPKDANQLVIDWTQGDKEALTHLDALGLAYWSGRGQ